MYERQIVSHIAMAIASRMDDNLYMSLGIISVEYISGTDSPPGCSFIHG